MARAGEAMFPVVGAAGGAGSGRAVVAPIEDAGTELVELRHELGIVNEELDRAKGALDSALDELRASNIELAALRQEIVDRNRAARRLDDDLVNILANLDLAVVLLARDATIERFTPAAARLLRLTDTDVGRNVGDLRSAIEGLDIVSVVAEMAVWEHPVRRTVRSAGRCYSFVARPYITLDGRLNGAVLSFFDVDAMVKTQEATAMARDSAERIVDTVRDGLLVLREDLSVRSVNRAFCQLFQLAPSEVIGEPLSTLGGGAWNDPALAVALAAVRSGSKLESFRLEGTFPAVGRRVLLLNANKLAGPSDAGGSLLLSIEDATEATRIEAAVREMLASAAEPVLMSDVKGRVVFANPAAHEAFGYDDGELVGTSVLSLVPERLRARPWEARSAFARAPSSVRPGESGADLVGLRKDGTEFAIEAALAPTQGLEGPLVVAFIHDVSARRESAREILDYQQRLQTMAFDAILSENRERRRIAADLHDGLGQTLALAQNKLAAARRGAKGPVRSAIEECRRLVAEAVEETRSLTFDLSPPILYDLGIEPALRWLAEQMEKRYGAQVEVEGAKALPMDAEVAAVVFRSARELLTNVFKHARTTSATVTLVQRGDAAGVTVTDHGAGFDVLARADSGPASGFGLFSVREQIERLGGTIALQSAPGKGTRVTLVVPCKRASSLASAEKESA